MASTLAGVYTAQRALALQKLMSATLFKLVGISDSDIIRPESVNLSGNQVLADSDLVGINNFVDLKEFILPALSMPLKSYGIDLTNFNKIERLISGMVATFPFAGDISDLRTLKYLLFFTGNYDSALPMNSIFKMPPLGLNPELEYVNISGQAINYGITELGDLGALRKLRIYGVRSAAQIEKATIDNILSTLNTAKTGTSPITVVNLGGTKAPTGGASNADAVALISAGVTVTLGTL